MTQSQIAHIFSTDFSPEEFKSRRETIVSKIGPGASALLQGAPRPPSAHPVFAQSKVFYYVCGIQLERCYLLIDGQQAKATLFAPQEQLSNIKGGSLDETAQAELCAISGITEVRSLEELESALEPVKTLYVMQRPDEHISASKFGLLGAARLRTEDPFDGFRRRDELLVDNLQRKFPTMTVADLDPIISEMRLIKSPAEIAVLRKTGEMSARMCIECMKSTKPGVPSSSMEAICDYVFRLEGNCGKAYEFILETSHAGSETLLDGDLVLVDCAPDYHCYTMDIARMWPVNGVFDEWQRHTYGLIVDYHKTLLGLTRPGKLVADIYDDAAELMLAKYNGDEVGTEILNNMIGRGVRYFNHHVGLSAHDAVMKWQETPIETGMVITVDPMVWLEDAPHGYVRVEDTIVITADGYESLTGSAPFEIDEIEELMKRPATIPEL